MMMEGFEMKKKHETPLHDVAWRLKRIAGELEKLASVLMWQEDSATDYVTLLEKIQKKFGDKRERFAQVISDNVHKHPKDIAELLKAEGILAQSMYWKDVSVLRWLGSIKGVWS